MFSREEGYFVSLTTNYVFPEKSHSEEIVIESELLLGNICSIYTYLNIFKCPISFSIVSNNGSRQDVLNKQMF